jgi:hypothetical protein
MTDDERMELTLERIRDEEPNTYREAAERFMSLLHYVINRMPNSVEKWGIAFATASPICLGRSMSEIAAHYGWSRAAVSYEARKCCDDNGLPPSTYMKSEKAILTAKKSRIKAVKNIERKQNERRTDDRTSRAD